MVLSNEIVPTSRFDEVTEALDILIVVIGRYVRFYVRFREFYRKNNFNLPLPLPSFTFFFIDRLTQTIDFIDYLTFYFFWRL